MNLVILSEYFFVDFAFYLGVNFYRTQEYCYIFLYIYGKSVVIRQ